MNRKISILALLAAIFAPPCWPAVKAPEERVAKIELADGLLGKRPVLVDNATIAAIGDAFDVGEEEIDIIVEEEIKDMPPQELIPLLARNVNPTGIFSIGGEYFLMFKEEKVKSGELIPVVYKKKEYILQITNVLRNGYNLRFEDAELEIKLR